MRSASARCSSPRLAVEAILGAGQTQKKAEDDILIGFLVLHVYCEYLYRDRQTDKQTDK